jgi:hypothetical protein
MHLSAYAQKHFGGRCCVPRSVAFWLEDPLLLFRGLFRGLLRGCLLGCFLSCHLPILPFRWFASRSATFVAVEEMYSFMRTQCQEKNDSGVEKVATIRSDSSCGFALRTSQHVTSMKECDRQTGNRIVPTMRKHSCSQISSEERKQTEKRAEGRQQEHRAHAFISMSCAEHQCGKHHARPCCAATPRREL